MMVDYMSILNCGSVGCDMIVYDDVLLYLIHYDVVELCFLILLLTLFSWP
jgi:hypothetical protein